MPGSSAVAAHATSIGALQRKRDLALRVLNELADTETQVILCGTKIEIDMFARCRVRAQSVYDRAVAELQRLSTS